MNSQMVNRAGYGARAVVAGTPDGFHNDAQTNVVDTLANIMLHCHLRSIDFAAALDSAEMHFEAEKDGQQE